MSARACFGFMSCVRTLCGRYFGNVCELDLIFNFHKAYYILDEVLVAGELQETSKKLIARLVSEQDQLVEAAKSGTVEEDGTPLQNP